MNSTDGTTSVDMSAIIDLQLLVQVGKKFLWLAKKAAVKASPNTAQFLTVQLYFFKDYTFNIIIIHKECGALRFFTQNYIAKKESK